MSTVVNDSDLQGPPVDRSLLPVCAAASALWQPLLVRPETTERTVLVELMAQDVRVSLRNLAVANAIRRETAARLVALVGVDPDWNASIWRNYDRAEQEALARAHGATDVIDVHELVAERLAGRSSEPTIAGRPLRRRAAGADADTLADIVRASTARILKIPRLSDEVRASPEHRRVEDLAREFSGLYDDLIEHTRTCAVVTSHVDYVFWGLLVDSARRARIPITHVQTTGSVKAYTLFPDRDHGEQSFRAALTHQIGRHFEDHVVRHRAILRRPAELVTARSRSNHGMPSWWRGGGTMSALEIRTAGERRALRQLAAARFGFDAARPTIGVYNHAVSDALNTNVEAFEDLGAWFEQTAEFAAAHPEVNWLFLDHPSQVLYDDQGFFDRVAARHADRGHMAFTPSMRLSKNVIFSLVDLGLTTRGSVSNELPAFGIPAIQAGWSEWSRCGLSVVADTPQRYWAELSRTIDDLVHERPVITRDQIERARLWLWFYRSGADVPSSFVPHWSLAEKRTMLKAVSTSMLNVPADGDPALVSISRMWRRQDPVMTRVDLTRSSDEVADALGIERDPAPDLLVGEPGRLAFHSEFDDVAQVMEVPGVLHSGSDPALAIVDWVARGEAIIGRVNRPKSLFALRIAPIETELVACTVIIGVDSLSDNWWDRHVKDRPRGANGRHRLVEVRIHHRPPELVSLTTSTVRLRTVLSRDELADGLLAVELSSPIIDPLAQQDLLPDAAVGARLGSVELQPIHRSAAAPVASAPAFVPLPSGRALVNPTVTGEPTRVRTVASGGIVRRAVRSAIRIGPHQRPFEMALPARPVLVSTAPEVIARGNDLGRPGVFVELSATGPAVVSLDRLPRPVSTRWSAVVDNGPPASAFPGMAATTAPTRSGP